MRRALSLFLVLAAAILGWTGSLPLDHPAPAPARPAAPGLDGPATARWAIRAPAAPPQPRPAAGVSNDLLGSLQRGIEAREYEATVNAEGLQAPNRAHGFRTYFEPTGIRVVERSARSTGLVALRLARLGRETRLEAIAPGTVDTRGARVEIRRNEDLVEWYENSPRGLEQGFTLAARPAGDGPVVLELAVAGARADATNDAATFATPTGRTLGYTGLAARDAQGRALAAHLIAERDRVRISVDDTGAAYPVTIDPLIGGTADGIIGLSQANSNYGLGLANAGDVNGDGYEDLLVGAYTYDSGQTDEGAVFLYLGSANGIPFGATPAATYQSDQIQGWMGYSVAGADVNGDGYSDVLAAGYDMSFGQAGEGAVCVFMGGPTVSDGTPGTAAALLQVNSVTAAFGQAVANAGDVNGDGYDDVLVGAPDYNNPGIGSTGAAFVFLGGASGVSTAPATTLSGNIATVDFGGAVAGVGDVNGDGYADISVADPQYKNGQTNEGGLFTWYGSATGIANGGISSAQSTLESNVVSDYLGYKAVAAAGDVNRDGYADVIVGCLNWTNGEASEGAAFILHGSPAGIASGSVGTVANTTLEMNSAGAGVNKVAGAGDVNGDGYADVVVGSPGYDFGGVANTGAMVVYLGGPSGVASVSPTGAHAFLHPGLMNDNYGFGLAMGDWNGDGYADVAAGAAGYDGAGANTGAVYLYSGSSRGINSQSETGAATIRQGEQTNARFGVVAAAVDVNADGYSDLIVGAPYYDAGETDEGAAFVYLGSSAGITSGAAASGGTMLQGNQAGASFGYAVATAGDVNDDGYADVLVGASTYDSGETDEGAAFVFLGSATGVANGNPSTAATTLQSNQANAHFGYAVAGFGDCNGDGYPDVAVGSPDYDSNGAVFVFDGAAGGIANGDPSNASRSLPGHLNGKFGSSVAGAGDTNADGYADLAIGEPSISVTFTEEGGAYVYMGSASGVQGFAHTQIYGMAANTNLGSAVACAGDVNGDGYDDLIVGAWRTGSTDFGAAYVFHGGALGVPSASPGTANAGFAGSTANAYMGAAVAGLGDVDGDGYGDIAIGSWNANSQGNVLVYRGSASGVVTSSASAILVTGQNFAALGDYVAGVGDVNGDGFADLAAGASTWDSGQTDEGGAFVWKGGGNLPTRASLARESRGNGSGIAVQPWSPAHSTSGFSAGMNTVDPSGRGRTKVEVEVCPEGKPFGSGTCTRQTSSTWTDAGVGIANPGVALAANVTVASPGLYNWRVRTLRAPFTVTQPGITARPNPAHGPWRRVQARAMNSDVRVDAVVLAVERPGTSADFAITPVGNPARGRIALAATLPNDAPAEVALFDVAGRQVVSRAIEGSPGRRTLTLARAGEIAPGVYLVRLTQGHRAATTRVVFVH